MCKSDGSNRPEHKHERDTPCYGFGRLIELHGQLLYCQGYREEVEGVPRPSQKCTGKEQPLLGVERAEQCDGILHFVHWRFQGRETCGQIPPSAHVFFGLMSSFVACIIALLGMLWLEAMLFFICHTVDVESAYSTMFLLRHPPNTLSSTVEIELRPARPASSA